jgi:DNA damage-inducible protein 1
VLEQKDGPQFIFGLDMLRRHQCCLDLAAGELRFGSCRAALRFLPEHEIPKDFKRHIDAVSQKEAEENMAGATKDGGCRRGRRWEGCALPGWGSEVVAGCAACAPARLPALPARLSRHCRRCPAGGEAPQGLLSPSAAARPSASAPAAAGPSSSAPAPGAPQQAAAGGGDAAAAGGSDREAKLARLMHLGFDRATCAAALDAANGSEDMAASILFGDMMM